MKILITGAGGFIGNYLLKNLSNSYQVLGVGRRGLDSVNYTSVDLIDETAVSSFFASHRFDVIIHLATIMATSDNIKDINVFFKNIEIQKNLITAINNQPNCHLINFSSSAVYPNITGEFTECDVIDPSVNGDALYGLAKFNSEMLFKSLLSAQVQQLHLRVGYVYGANMDDSRIHSVFANELKSLNKITVRGNGKRTIPQIEITSLINKINQFIAQKISGTINVADENISLEDLAKRIIENEGNQQSSISYVESGNKNTFKLNIKKLEALLSC